MSCPYETQLLSAWQAAPNQGSHSAPDCAPDSAHDLAHIRRVWANCEALARESTPAPDMELLRAAAVLHDLVSLPKDAPDRASASRLSAEAAAPLALKAGLPAQKIPALKHAILAHSFSANVAPQTLEAKILQDADRLDALGAIGLARLFLVSGALNRPLYDPDDPAAQTRAPDDSRFALDHLYTKVFKLAQTMQTPEGRALAEARSAYMRSFLAQLLAEARSV